MRVLQQVVLQRTELLLLQVLTPLAAEHARLDEDHAEA
jgi:hypothetical protein